MPRLWKLLRDALLFCFQVRRFSLQRHHLLCISTQQPRTYYCMPLSSLFPPDRCLGNLQEQLRRARKTQPRRTPSNNLGSACRRRSKNSDYFCSCRRKIRVLQFVPKSPIKALSCRELAKARDACPDKAGLGKGTSSPRPTQKPTQRLAPPSEVGDPPPSTNAHDHLLLLLQPLLSPPLQKQRTPFLDSRERMVVPRTIVG